MKRNRPINAEARSTTAVRPQRHRKDWKNPRHTAVHVDIDGGRLRWCGTWRGGSRRGGLGNGYGEGPGHNGVDGVRDGVLDGLNGGLINVPTRTSTTRPCGSEPRTIAGRVRNHVDRHKRVAERYEPQGDAHE